MYSDKPTGVGIFIREAWARLVQQQLIGKHSTLYVYSTENLALPQAVKVIRLPAVLELIFKRSLSLHRIAWNIFYLPLIARNYDMVYSFSSHGSPFIQQQVITIHDLICMQFPRQHKTQYYYFTYLLPRIIKSCVKVVTVSAFTKAEVVKHYSVAPGTIAVISGAADHLQPVAAAGMPAHENTTAKWLADKQFFLTVGASYPHKNIERLVAATKLLDKDILLVIVGSGNTYYNELKEKYADEQIHFLEYVSQAMLGFLYAHCIANVYISLYEGMGFPPYEAALYNTVTIASNTTAIPEIYGDALYYVDAFDTDNIAAALKAFSSGQVDKSTYQRRFKALLEKYTWQRTATGISQLIHGTLQQKAG